MKDKTYLQRFLSLKCSGDVLNVVSPVNRYEKEISESWGILKRIRPLTLRDKNTYTILDLCAGNALTSVIAAFMLPVKEAIAVDIKKRERNWEEIRKFKYFQEDIYGVNIMSWNYDYIIISSHPCKHAMVIIDIFNNSSVKALCLIPCCHDVINLPASHFLQEKMGKYDAWTYYLASLITKDAKVIIQTDKRIQSPKNNVIYAERP